LRISLSLTEIETNLGDLKDQVKDQDTAEIARRRESRDLKQKNLGAIEQSIKDVKSDIDRDSARQRDIARVISNNPENRHRRSTRKVEIYEGLERVFEDAVTQLRDRLRDQVEKHASETFLRLTTESTYKGLEINENYGLSILDEHNRVVQIRSAGAEQIVALSLIDGLNRTARQRGPIIMDTPLGRLDLRHREAVLTEVPRMADQVILLVHEGEIDRETGLGPLASRIGRLYEIQRVSSTESRIRPITDEVTA
jgi:DNA sulfur modification protein DndD